GLSRDRFKVIDRHDRPALHFGVHSAPSFMVFGAFSLSLFLRANPEPYSDPLILPIILACRPYVLAKFSRLSHYACLQLTGLEVLKSFSVSTLEAPGKALKPYIPAASGNSLRPLHSLETPGNYPRHRFTAPRRFSGGLVTDLDLISADRFHLLLRAGRRF